MIQTADVYAAFRRLWNGSQLDRIVAGGLWEGRPKQDAGAAASGSLYAVAEVEEGEPQWNSTQAYVQPFTLTVTVWSDGGAAQTGPVQDLLRKTLNRNNAAGLSVKSATKTLDARPLAGSVKKDSSKRNAADIQVTQCRWEILLQGIQ